MPAATNSLSERVSNGEPAAVARAISKIEDGTAGAAVLMKEIYQLSRGALVIGITGAPGAGKSSLVDKLALLYRQRGERVGIVAVDPSSPFSGGAILGDRIRMQGHAGDTPVKAARARGISVSLNNENEGANMPSEINVIGQTVDVASREVEKFVDRAFLAGLPRVRGVHGSGMGILRKALRQLLQQHPHVESVAEAPQNEGGGGATLVELRV